MQRSARRARLGALRRGSEPTVAESHVPPRHPDPATRGAARVSPRTYAARREVPPEGSGRTPRRPTDGWRRAAAPRGAGALALVAAVAFGAHGCSLLAPNDDELMGGAARGTTRTSMPCAPGTKRCEEACVSIDAASTGCGGTSCAPCAFDHGAAVCVAGECALGPCASGFADCDGAKENGCEAELSFDDAHCGACNAPCPTASPYCEETTCFSRCAAASVERAGASFPGSATGFPKGQDDFTFEAWLAWHGRFGTPGTATGFFGTDWQYDARSFNVLCTESAGVTTCTCQLTGAADEVEAARATLGDRSYHHLACVRSGGKLTAFADGVPQESVPATLDVVPANRFNIGYQQQAGSASPVRFGPMRLSSVARYASAFTPRRTWVVDEAAVFQYLVSTSFDGTTLLDETGRGHTVVIAGFDFVPEPDSPCGRAQ